MFKNLKTIFISFRCIKQCNRPLTLHKVIFGDSTQYCPNVSFVSQEPTLDTTLHLVIMCHLLLAVAVPQTVLILDDLDSFEGPWSCIFLNVPLLGFA